jgi:hypothetical protein
MVIFNLGELAYGLMQLLFNNYVIILRFYTFYGNVSIHLGITVDLSNNRSEFQANLNLLLRIVQFSYQMFI